MISYYVILVIISYSVMISITHSHEEGKLPKNIENTENTAET